MSDSRRPFLSEDLKKRFLALSEPERKRVMHMVKAAMEKKQAQVSSQKKEEGEQAAK